MSTITLDVPDTLYQRLIDTATAMKRPLQEVILRALTVGCPPIWDDIPAEFKGEIAALDHLDDNQLWRLAQGQKLANELSRYDELLALKQDRALSIPEQQELSRLRYEADLFVLQKAQAGALLRWRGNMVQLL
jgi:hypothetical protein